MSNATITRMTTDRLRREVAIHEAEATRNWNLGFREAAHARAATASTFRQELDRRTGFDLLAIIGGAK